MTIIDRRDWATLAVTSTVIPAADREVAEEIAAIGSHITVVSREPGGDWEPATVPGTPTRYAFLVDGEMRSGTLTDYALAWMTARAVGGTVSPEVHTWAGAAFRVRVSYASSADGRLCYQLAIGGETALVRIGDA
ncbi:hypothetical protein [Streptomyces sp. YIM S03343]